MQSAEQQDRSDIPPDLIHQLPHGLHRLVEDCFDEEQYDHAITLIDQLRAESIRPTQQQLRKVFAVSLCSLPPCPISSIASSSSYTLDQELSDDKAARRWARLLRSRHRPSQNSISTASRILLQLGKSWLHPTVVDSSDHISAKDAQLARYVLGCLPCHAHDDARSSNNGNRVSKGQTRSTTPTPDVGENTDKGAPLSRWMQERFEAAEDVWDLLSGGQTAASASKPPQADQSRPVDDFWMSERERKAVTEEIDERSPWPPTRRKPRAKSRPSSSKISTSSSDTDSMKSSSESLSDDSDFKGAKTKPTRRSVPPASSRKSRNARSTRANARRTGVYSDEEDGTDGSGSAGRLPRFRLTEGAWRTLRVLVELWQSDTTSQDHHRTCFVEQFPPSEHRRRLLSSPWRQRAKSGAFDSDRGSTEVKKALDVAFSFTAMTPALWWQERAKEGTKSKGSVDDERRGELAWRRQDSAQMAHESMQRRVEAAASLLALMYAHVRRNLLDEGAVVRGMATRLCALDIDQVRTLTIKLQRVEPGLLATTLLAHLALVTSAAPGTQSSQVDNEVAVQHNGLTTKVRTDFIHELTSAERVLASFKRLVREDATLAKVQDWIDHAEHAGLYRQTDLFAPRNEKDSDGENGSDEDKDGEVDDDGLPWFVYRSLMTHRKRDGTPDRAARDNAHRIAALLRLHTISEHVRTMHIKWFVLLCLLEMLQQAHPDFEDLSQRSLGTASTPVGSSREADPASRQAVATVVVGLEKAFRQDIEEMELAVDAMREYEERARSGLPSSSPQSRSGAADKKTQKKGAAKVTYVEPILPAVGETAVRCAQQVQKVKDLVETLELLRASWGLAAAEEADVMIVDSD